MSDEKIAIAISGYTKHQLLKDVVDYIVNNEERTTVEEMVKLRVSELVDDSISKLSEQSLESEIAKVIERGWPTTNQYGEVTGHVTFSQRVSKAMFETRDSYSRQTLVEQMTKDAIDKALRAEIGKELERARDAIRQQVDQVVQAKLNEVLRSTLGIK